MKPRIASILFDFAFLQVVIWVCYWGSHYLKFSFEDWMLSVVLFWLFRVMDGLYDIKQTLKNPPWFYRG